MTEYGIATGARQARSTAGRSRLPLWAFVCEVVTHGWDAANASYDIEERGLTAFDCGYFLYCLLEQRGEFGRLACILADVERLELAGGKGAWWQRKGSRDRVIRQLRRCLAVRQRWRALGTGS